MKLSIGKTLMTYEINEEQRSVFITEFFIEEKPLSEIIGIQRNLSTSETYFSYDSKDITNRAIKCFLGEVEAANQFGSNRIVLYRCHCGADYCGVISFRLVIEDDIVIWKDIAYEDDDGFGINSQVGSEDEDKESEDEDEGRITTKISELSFDKKEYFAELARIGNSTWNKPDTKKIYSIKQRILKIISWILPKSKISIIK